MRTSTLRLIAAGLVCLAGTPAHAQSQAPAGENFDAWPVLKNPFESTGGGGIMIGGYEPVVSGSVCATDFTATEPNGAVHENRVEFDAVPTQGGILCTNGRWRARDGSSSGTTPFRVVIKDGVVRRSP